MAASRRIDPRLVIGVLLVVIAMVGAVSTVLSVQRTQTVFALSQPVASGQVIPAEALIPVSVTDDERVSLYLAPGNRPEGELTATRPIGAGELVPLSGIGDADTSLTTVVVPLTGSLQQQIGVGSGVELWAAMPSDRPGEFAAPEVLAPATQVVRIIEQERMVGAGEREIELLVPARILPTVLSAVANGAQLMVVPTSRPVG